MNRWKASATHLVVCIVIAISVLLLMVLAWFPPPYFSAQGGKDLLLLIVGVDIVLGPLITLIVFKQGKKGLRFDLAVIAILQLSALAYGIFAISKARPVYMVYAIDRFEIINASAIDPTDMTKAALEEFKTLPFVGPKLIAAKLPDNIQENNALMFSAVSGGPDLSALPKYYVPYKTQKQNVINHLKPLSRLKASARQAKIDLDEIIRVSGIKKNELGFLPVATAKDDLAAIISRNSGEIIDVVPIDPWV